MLTGGEIPAMAVADAVCRMVPGVLPDETAFQEESHWNGLLEYPQYTHPAEWRGQAVPEVLTCPAIMQTLPAGGVRCRSSAPSGTGPTCLQPLSHRTSRTAKFLPNWKPKIDCCRKTDIFPVFRLFYV